LKATAKQNYEKDLAAIEEKRFLLYAKAAEALKLIK
jgi:hypothetical protein